MQCKDLLQMQLDFAIKLGYTYYATKDWNLYDKNLISYNKSYCFLTAHYHTESHRNIVKVDF